jgi:hypothetical protein
MQASAQEAPTFMRALISTFRLGARGFNTD